MVNLLLTNVVIIVLRKQLQLVVDIVSGGSGCWIKVVARNPRALAVNSQGGAQFGQKNIIDQVFCFHFPVCLLFNSPLR